MSKTNKQKRKQKKARKLESLRKKPITSSVPRKSFNYPYLQEHPNPLAGLGEEQLNYVRREISSRCKERTSEIFEELGEILTLVDPVQLLSVLSGYGLAAKVGDEGVISTDSIGGLTQWHVELIQALVLAKSKDSLGQRPLHPAEMQQVFDLLTELSTLVGSLRLDSVNGESAADERSVAFIQELVRFNTQSVRNWGYFRQVKKITRELYGVFGDKPYIVNGHTVLDVLSVFEFLVDDVDRAMSLRFRRLKELKAVKNKEKMVVAYHQMIGQGETEAKEFCELVNIREIKHKHLFAMLFSHDQVRMFEDYVFVASEISRTVGLSESVVVSVLDDFSFNFGDLCESKEEYFLLDNPVWAKPAISLGQGAFFCPMPQVFFSFVLDNLDRFIEKVDKDSLHDRRSSYLEEKIESIVKLGFPEANIVSGLKWTADGKDYETDLLVFIDSYAIIIEAKSHKITRPALRGAPERIRRHLKDVLIEPGIQSKRLEDKLYQLINEPASSDPLVDLLPVQLSSIHKVLRVSVTLEDFASLQSNLRLFEGAGWLSRGFVPPPTMTLASFETLFDYLEHPVQILHYLERRSEIEQEAPMFGDELDYMGLYEKTLLVRPDLGEQRGREMVIVGMSEVLDKYYMSVDAGIDVAKPTPKIAPLFQGILEKLEERKSPRWTEISVFLLRILPQDQFKIARSVSAIRKRVEKSWKQEGHINSVIYTPGKQSSYALAYVMFKDENEKLRDQFLQSAIAEALDYDHVEFCVGVAKNIDKNDLPYHLIAVSQASKN